MIPDASAFTVASAVCAAVTDMMRMCCGAVAFNGNLSECGNDGAAAWANDGALNIRSADSRGGNWWQLASGLLSWTASYPPLAACAPPPPSVLLNKLWRDWDTG